MAMDGHVVVGNRVDESDSEIRGRVVDSRTGRPVGGALVIALKPTTRMRSFLKGRDESDVQSSTETNSNGDFILPDQLPKGMAYGLVVAARGYDPLTVEGALRVGPGAPEQADIGEIELIPA